MDVRGHLDGATLAAAVDDVVARHDALRMVFASMEPQPALRFVPGYEPTLVHSDLTGLDEATQIQRVWHVCEAERNRDVDLMHGPLWRLTVVRLAAERTVLVASFCHLVADGWSSQLFLRDLAVAYDARRRGVAGPPPLPTCYRDVIEARRELAAGRAARAAFLRARLLPLATTVPFPVADPDATVDLSSEDECPFVFSQQVADDLFALAQRAQTTPFNALLAAYATLLAIRTGQSRVVIGSTTLGRTLPGALDLIGQFTNNIYIETTVRPQTQLVDVVREVHATMVDTVRHVAPFYEIAEAVNPDFAHQRPWPFLHLYHAWFQSQAPSSEPVAVPGLTFEWVRQGPAGPPGVAGARTESHLAVVTGDLERNAMIKRGAPCVEVSDDRRGGVILYNPDFFASDMVAELARDYECLVEAMVTNPWQTAADLEEQYF
jgi:hypothetical protein